MGLLDALNSSFYTPEEDPFGIGASVIGASAPGLTSPFQSSGKNIGTAVGAALLAGLLGGYAKKRTNEANQGLLSQAMDAMRLGGSDRYDRLAQEPRLAPFASALKSSEYENQIERANKAEDIQNELNKATQIEKMKAYYSDPATAKNANPNIESELGITAPAPLPGPAKEETILEKITKLPKEQREMAHKELPTYQKREFVMANVDDAFKSATDLSFSAAAMPLSETSSRVDKINTLISDMIQGASGKERSDPSINRLINGLLITPKDLARPKILEEKHAAAKVAIESYMIPTPILEMTNIVKPSGNKFMPVVSGEKEKAPIPTPGKMILAPDGRNIFISK